jgi:hypothetical protein
LLPKAGTITTLTSGENAMTNEEKRAQAEAEKELAIKCADHLFQARLSAHRREQCFGGEPIMPEGYQRLEDIFEEYRQAIKNVLEAYYNDVSTGGSDEYSDH